ncbi:zinc-binding alcohol dehydrogenase family protein [Colwellia sp. 4_MG-2023]|uniref:zinc-binding alcohol dehydrogenase family protein n=1 Tax=unclassified Colwellia TaxID=196834 RepID=UPI001C09E55D|nr:MULTISPECIES: zinc-binding alcohol dehydrogenase family protein [unclassified Colwellia]MBU2923718.1 zinc-binding alcohol dehydrogenase family protein [Colwellia sp. C2M11]MDO6505759.1 zinc-binding alcohol dehydrogenase family protein [Colwellia sp. 5_MG-2023]MDO6554440.1 zinc-binding alcohol dehydrogenase family protein [Colwellia sp. 4_MG-2023]MDO6652182.1 zinc-binding alcohol dehydrogenase family protein [Colwellia sp. 3_MG-2023]MDO6664649.1 zinc-binding alcohol dehydrogenase family prot
MKAIGYEKSLPISELASLVDIEMQQPTASGHDLLVRVKSIAVNPVDCKIRQNVSPEGSEYKVIGWDAVGEVVGVGELVTHFKLGDSVFYAGDLNRQGCNAEYQLVDERIVGNKPKSLSDSEAAALPLTSITAWELLFERLAIKQQQPDNKDKSKDVLLIVGAAGGVGSILVQLASVLTGATVIATASRDSSAEWVKKLGADHVVDHSKPLVAQIEQLNIGQVTHVASLTHTDSYMDSYVEMLAPMGRIALIDDPQSVDIKKLKPKSLSLHWEFMFTRSMFQTEDINEQHNLLNSIAELIDQGYLQTTVGKHLGGINATNLRAAHADIESGKSIGKIVLEGF